jgi:hypothetical protein
LTWPKAPPRPSFEAIIGASPSGISCWKANGDRRENEAAPSRDRAAFPLSGAADTRQGSDRTKLFPAIAAKLRVRFTLNGGTLPASTRRAAGVALVALGGARFYYLMLCDFCHAGP